MSFLLDATYLENLAQGAMIFGAGIAIVFSVIFILFLTLMVFKFVFHDLKVKKPVKKADPAPVIPSYVPPVANENEEIVAVIAAAIAMAEAESGGVKFRVVSFKRK